MDNIVKNNKKIALFMGGKTSETSRLDLDPHDMWVPMFGICRWDTVELGKGKIFKYHKSWEWLMPVLAKINSLNNDSQKISLLQINIQEAVSWVNLDEAYTAIVDYIEVHNKNKDNG